LKRCNSKWPEVKVFLSWIYSSQNVLELYLVQGFNHKNVVLGDFSIKMAQLPNVCDGVFLYSGWLGVIYDSQATNRSVAGVTPRRPIELWPSHGVLLLPIGHLEVTYDSQPHGCALCTFYCHQGLDKGT
jgi:hypothetical protein